MPTTSCICTSSMSLCAASSYITPPPPPPTTLQVTEVTQNSVRLTWTPLPRARGYILRWREETGEKCNYIFVMINMPPYSPIF